MEEIKTLEQIMLKKAAQNENNENNFSTTFIIFHHFRAKSGTFFIFWIGLNCI